MARTRCAKHDIVVDHPDDGEVSTTNGFVHCPKCKEEAQASGGRPVAVTEK